MDALLLDNYTRMTSGIENEQNNNWKPDPMSGLTPKYHTINTVPVKQGNTTTKGAI